MFSINLSLLQPMHFREIGLIKASGKISEGNFTVFNIGSSILFNKSKTPDALKIPMDKNKPINVGIIFITISIPSLAPCINISKTCFFSNNPYNKIIKIVKGIAKLEI